MKNFVDMISSLEYFGMQLFSISGKQKLLIIVVKMVPPRFIDLTSCQPTKIRGEIKLGGRTGESS
jgi:hypothetical protein